jgi:hypothetical protein
MATAVMMTPAEMDVGTASVAKTTAAGTTFPLQLQLHLEVVVNYWGDR